MELPHLTGIHDDDDGDDDDDDDDYDDDDDDYGKLVFLNDIIFKYFARDLIVPW